MRWRRYLRGVRGRAGSITKQFAGCDENSRDLLLRMLAFNPERRASPNEILAHEYFREEEASVSAAAASDDGADSSSDDSSAESPCSRLALHAWNVEALHPRALVPLRLAVDMPPDMSSLAKSLGLNVEYVTLGRAAEAAARAGGAGARNALRSERREAAKGRVRRMVARKGRSEE